MKNNPVITATELTKIYCLYDRQIDRVKETFSPFRKKYHKPFYALKNISLAIHRGETIGIVGRNGSGKSTLLQLICGILQPSTGSIAVHGRISALLELGAGFNPEFTGRQNVYLNGAILGLSKKAIDEHLDDILAFADIGPFIDQPVRSYSSGMYVRLAFSVAINVDPDILIVDEALAVGDESFQRKCFGRIHQIQERGSTVLFVSHSASSVIELCSRALLFDAGELLIAGSPKRVVGLYQKMLYATPPQVRQMREGWLQDENRLQLHDEGEESSRGNIDNAAGQEQVESPEGQGSDAEGFDPGLVPADTIEYERQGARIEDPAIYNRAGEKVNVLRSGERYWYCYRVFFEKDQRNIYFGMLIKTLKGVELSGFSAPVDLDGENFLPGNSCWQARFSFTCRLNPGVYFLNAGVLSRENGEDRFLDRQIDAAMFRVRYKRDPGVTATVDLVASAEINKIDG